MSAACVAAEVCCSHVDVTDVTEGEGVAPGPYLHSSPKEAHPVYFYGMLSFGLWRFTRTVKATTKSENDEDKTGEAPSCQRAAVAVGWRVSVAISSACVLLYSDEVLNTTAASWSAMARSWSSTQSAIRSRVQR